MTLPPPPPPWPYMGGPVVLPPEARLQPPPTATFVWGLAFATRAFFTLFFFAIPFSLRTFTLLPFLGVLAISLAAGLLLGAWYRAGFIIHFAPQSVTVDRGLLTRRKDVVPYARIQTVLIRQGPLQRFLGLADVLVQTAKQFSSGEPSEPGGRQSQVIDAGLHQRFEGVLRHLINAEAVRDFLLAQAEAARVAATPPVPIAAGAQPHHARARVPDDLPPLFAEVAGALRKLAGAPENVPALENVPLSPSARTLWTIRWGLGGAVLALLLIPFFPLFSAALIPTVFVLAHLAARVYWRHYRVEILPEELRITRGLIAIRKAIIPYRRIQNVNIMAGPIERVLGLATLSIEAAGPAIHEGYLDGVSSAEPVVAFLQGRAERARFDDALGDRVASTDVRSHVVDELRAVNSLLERRTAARHGGGDPLGGGVWLDGERVLSERWAAASAVAWFPIGFALWIPTLILVLVSRELVILLFIALVFGPACFLYGYTKVQRRAFGFRFGPESVEVVRGVLTRSRDVIPYRRLQGVGLYRGPLMRALGFSSIRLTTAGASTALREFPALEEPEPYLGFLLERASQSGPLGEAATPLQELAAETERTARIVREVVRPTGI